MLGDQVNGTLAISRSYLFNENRTVLNRNFQVHWCHILDQSDNCLDHHQCQHSVNKRIEPYRFSVSVRRLAFPPEPLAIGPGSKAWVQPAHRITILPPISLINLLPVQLYYCVQGGPLQVHSAVQEMLEFWSTLTFPINYNVYLCYMNWYSKCIDYIITTL